MLPIVFIGLTGALLATAPEPGPSAEWLYNGVDRPVMISITAKPAIRPPMCACQEIPRTTKVNTRLMAMRNPMLRSAAAAIASRL